jgi:hypothetical protein
MLCGLNVGGHGVSGEGLVSPEPPSYCFVSFYLVNANTASSRRAVSVK